LLESAILTVGDGVTISVKQDVSNTGEAGEYHE